MTEERMALLECVRKSGEPDFLRELLQFTVQRLMESEVEGRCGAARHERTEDRTNSRNGYRERPAGSTHPEGARGGRGPHVLRAELV